MTERVGLGTGVLVLPQRQPVVTAKQVASIDVASGGRLTARRRRRLARGGVRRARTSRSTRRGSRFEEWIALLRACWTGTPEPFEGRHYTLPPDILCLPTPAHRVPLLVGGHTKPAIRRAATIGDGWLGQQSLGALDPARSAPCADAGARPGRAADRRGGGTGAPSSPRGSRELAEAGVDEVIVDVDWAAGDPAAELDALKSAVA